MSLDHNPEFPPDWDDSKVIPGELHVPDDLSEEDIPPGIVVPYEPRTPVVRNAAVAVAGTAGRGVGAGARGIGTLGRWFGTGARGVTYLGYRYIRAHDLQEVIGGMQKKSDWSKVEIVRRARWKLLAKLGIGTGAVNVAEWIALWWPADLEPFGWAAVIPPTSTGLIAGVAVTAYGRYRANRPEIAPGAYIAEQDDPESDEPFPLAVCQSPGQVEECVSRALAWEGIGTRHVQVLGYRGWGWEIDVTLKGSTPGKVNAVAEQLDAHFDIKAGGTLIDPDAQKAAHIVLRLITSDPFAKKPAPVVHAPNSLDISDAHNLAYCMDGSQLDQVLEGQRILVVGVSGSAKSTGVLRDLAEVVTACHNAIALEMDPVKDGMREFEGVMAVPPIRGKKACEEWLGHLVKMATARNVVRNRLRMGDTWVATREHPAIFVFVDEYIYLSPRGKELFIELLRLAKQSGMYPVAAGQDATSDSMGDAVADSFTLKIMLAARHADIPIVLGTGAIAAGFRPDRLVPALNKDIKNDAGQSYIKGPGLSRPLLYGWNEHSRSNIEQAVQDRIEAGRPWFDRDTLAAAGLLHLMDGGVSSGPITGDRQIVVDAIEVMGDAGVERIRPESLAEALQRFDPETYGSLCAASLRKAFKEVGVGAPVPIGDIDGLKNPRGYKLEALTTLT
jgi:S-DNA-T family DNA segregation ATPase FtsK/SpoIIIE